MRKIGGTPSNFVESQSLCGVMQAFGLYVQVAARPLKFWIHMSNEHFFWNPVSFGEQFSFLRPLERGDEQKL